MYFIGVIIMLFGISATCYFKHVPFAVFANPAVILAMFVTITGIIVATSSFKIFIRGFNAILSSKYHISDDDRNKAVELYRLLSKSSIYASIIVVFIGIIAALGNMSDLEVLSHAISAALISPIYGLVLPLVFFEPAIRVLKSPRQKIEAAKVYPKHLGDRLMELCIQSGLTPEEIQNATSIELKSNR